jgi:hypothetical protein
VGGWDFQFLHICVQQHCAAGEAAPETKTTAASNNWRKVIKVGGWDFKFLHICVQQHCAAGEAAPETKTTAASKQLASSIQASYVHIQAHKIDFGSISYFSDLDWIAPCCLFGLC